MMRRKDREITDRAEIEEILRQCRVAHIAFQDEEAPYLVPMNFGYDWQEQLPVLYFHCADQGKKLSLLEKYPKVGIEMDCGHQLVGEGKACSYGFLFQSIIGWGMAEKVGLTCRKTARPCLLDAPANGLGVFDFRGRSGFGNGVPCPCLCNFCQSPEKFLTFRGKTSCYSCLTT